VNTTISEHNSHALLLPKQGRQRLQQPDAITYVPVLQKC
jgi:hypothetical protein